MKAIYEPQGKALEYCTKRKKRKCACNLYGGCGHGCFDCYVPNNHHLMRTYGFKSRQEFYKNPHPRDGIIEALKREAPRYQGEEVFLCFTCDPYQPINEKYQLTRQAIEILHANEIAVNILTKGKITDFDLLAKRPDLSKVGVTLTTTHPATSREWEPNACLPNDRMRNINKARDLGIFTWASLEPIRSPESTLNVIKWSHDYIDEYKLGKWNYDPRAKDIDWHKLVHEAIELLEKLGCKYYIKEDLRKHI